MRYRLEERRGGWEKERKPPERAVFVIDLSLGFEDQILTPYSDCGTVV